MPCSCWRNIILLTGKVRVMLTMPLPHPATYSRHSRAGPDNGPDTGDTGTSMTAPGWYFLLPAATHSPVLHITTSFAIIVSIAVAPPPHLILVIVNSENTKPLIFLILHSSHVPACGLSRQQAKT